MKKILILVSFLSIASCVSNIDANEPNTSDIEVDASKVCALLTQAEAMIPLITEMAGQMLNTDDEKLKIIAYEQYSKLKVQFENKLIETEALYSKYDDDELRFFVFENCPAVKRITQTFNSQSFE